MKETQNNKLSLSAGLPYEKFLTYGPEHLSDAELLAIILRTGTKGEDTVSIARRILELPKGRRKGLLGLHSVSVEQLMAIRGIGEVKAVRVKCVAELSNRLSRAEAEETLQFTRPESVAAYYMERLRNEETEQVILVLMDNKNYLLKDLVISKGTVNASLLSPREIFIAALEHRAVCIMLVHNHPSGDADPSRQDIRITEQVRRASQLLEIPLIDHVIIGDRRFTSFKQQGLL